MLKPLGHKYCLVFFLLLIILIKLCWVLNKSPLIHLPIFHSLQMRLTTEFYHNRDDTIQTADCHRFINFPNQCRRVPTYLGDQSVICSKPITTEVTCLLSAVSKFLWYSQQRWSNTECVVRVIAASATGRAGNGHSLGTPHFTPLGRKMNVNRINVFNID